VLIVSTLVLIVAAFGPPLATARRRRACLPSACLFPVCADPAILALFARSNFALQLGGQLQST